MYPLGAGGRLVAAAVAAGALLAGGANAAPETQTRSVAPTPAPTPTPMPTGTVQVSVTLTDAQGADQPAIDAVVWLDGVPGEPAQAGRVAARVAQRHKTFEPHVEAVRVGSTVAFPNLDRIYHNVFSLSEIAPFDLGLYRNGASRSLVFPRPGVVRIYCNIHPDMAAFLVVVDSASFGKTGADGRLELRNVPAGTWPLSVWHEKGGEQRVNVAVDPGRTTRTTVRLDAGQWRPIAHKNKYGKDYPPPDDDENRY